MTDMWNSVAAAWERNADFIDEFTGDATEALLDAAGVSEGEAVLDLATGAGGAGLAAAARVGPSGRVVLADSASEMVAAAARRAGGRPGVETAEFDQSAIAAAEDSFDVVIIRHGLMFVDPPSDAVREAARVLRPGGRYAAMTWHRRDANPWLGLILDAVGEQFGVEFPPPGIAGPFSLPDPAALATVLKEGGLEDVEIAVVATPMSAPSLDAWWERVPQFAGPLAIALAGMEPEVREEIRQRALASAREVASDAGDGGVVLDGSVLNATGVKPR